MPTPPPYRDVTVGRLLSLLADALPGREALVYSHAGRAMDVSRAGRRGAAHRARADRPRREAWRPRRGVGDQRARVDRPAVRAGEDRRDSRHRQHRAARARDRIPAAAERDVHARHHRAASAASTISTSCARSARSATDACAARGDSLPHLARVFFIGDDCPPISRRTTTCAHAADAMPDDAARRLRERRRPGRRDQHAVHVGHDGFPEGRDALEPQHRQQRLSARHRGSASRPTIGCACACRSSTASAA